MQPERLVTQPAFAETLKRSAEAGVLAGLPDSMDPSAISAKLEGTGESYAVWSLSDDDSSCMLRIPLRPLKEMPHPMDREFQVASCVSPDVGPRALYFEPDPGNPLGAPYIVSEFTPGGTKRERQWTQSDFDSLVPVIATLHSGPSWDLEGGAGDINLLNGFRQARSWWQENAPQTAAPDHVAALGDRAERFIESNQWASEGAQVCAIHSDLCATNIVFDGQDRPRLIDWEWAENGDPAKDLAYVGGEAYCDPWYVPMSRADVKRFVRSYVVQMHPELSSDELEDEYQRLLARRDSWEAWERYTMGLHCLKRGREENDGFYLSAGEQMHQRLQALLDREEVT
ncbi:MAG: phosphotransferase [Scrofimicrobium sp.]